MCEQAFKNLDNVLRKESGCGSERDYTKQTSRLLLLKYLDDTEERRQFDAELVGKPYAPLLPDDLRWSAWAAPVGKEASADGAAA